LAPSGIGSGTGESPMATTPPTSSGSTMVFSVRRIRVAPLEGLTRSSTRSAAFWAYAGFVGYR
jgi:hypothetical protein